MRYRPGRAPLASGVIFLILLMIGVAVILTAILERIIRLMLVVSP